MVVFPARSCGTGRRHDRELACDGEVLGLVQQDVQGVN